MAGKKHKSDDPIFEIHKHNLDFHSNEIYLFGEEEYSNLEDDGAFGEPGVEFVMANTFIRNLNILMKKSSDPILIHMKSCGGDWGEGMAIYDSIKLCPNEITILSYTHARSMTSLIFQAADKRLMMPHSVFMFHEGSMAYIGTSKQFKTEAKMLQITNDQMMDIYVESMKYSGKYKTKSKKWIRTWLKKEMNAQEEVYLSAQEAIDLGFADEIYTGKL